MSVTTSVNNGVHDSSQFGVHLRCSLQDDLSCPYLSFAAQRRQPLRYKCATLKQYFFHKRFHSYFPTLQTNITFLNTKNVWNIPKIIHYILSDTIKGLLLNIFFQDKYIYIYIPFLPPPFFFNSCSHNIELKRDDV